MYQIYENLPTETPLIACHRKCHRVGPINLIFLKRDIDLLLEFNTGPSILKHVQFKNCFDLNFQ